MGIRFFCPNGHKLNVKAHQAGQRGICPVCGTKVQIPLESTRPGSSNRKKKGDQATTADAEPQSESELGAVPLPSPQVSTVLPGPPAQAPPPNSEIPTHTAAPSSADAESQAEHVLPQSAAAPSPLFLNPAEPTAADAASFGAETDLSAVGPPPLASDPLSDAADIIWYVRPPSGGQYGPATSPIMRAWIAEGRVPPDALVWREGWRDWQQASAVFSQLRSDEEPNSLEAISPRNSSLPKGRAAASPGAARARSKSKNTALIVLLVLAAIVLFAVFLWVVFSGPRSTSMVLIAPATAAITAVGQRRVFHLRKPQTPT